MKAGFVLGMAGALALGVPLSGRCQQLAYTGSVQFATGDYIFTERTESVYVLNGFDLTAGRFHVQASVPVVSQSTPWISYGPTPIPSGGSQSGEVSRQMSGRGRLGTGTSGSRTPVQLPTDASGYESAIADPLVSGDVEVIRTSTGSLALTLGGAVKWPVSGPEEGFGTGEWDYSAMVSTSHQTSARDSLFSDFSYWVYGDMPDLAFRKALAYSLAYGRIVVPGRWSMLASVYGGTSALENSEPPLQVGFGLTRFFDGGRNVSVNAAVGLTETVPLVSLGVAWWIGL